MFHHGLENLSTERCFYLHSFLYSATSSRLTFILWKGFNQLETPKELQDFYSTSRISILSSRTLIDTFVGTSTSNTELFRVCDIPLHRMTRQCIFTVELVFLFLYNICNISIFTCHRFKSLNYSIPDFNSKKGGCLVIGLTWAFQGSL